MPPAQGAGAVQLDGGVDDVLRGLGGVQLGHRRPARHAVLPRVVRRGRRVDQKAGGLGAGGHLRHLVRDGLEVAQRAAERGAPGRVVQGRVEGGAGHPDGERPDAGPEEVEGAHRDAEAPVGLAEHIVGGDRYAVELQGADGVRGEHVEGGARESGTVGRNQERGDATGSRTGGGPGEDHGEVGLGGVGDPALLAGERPAARGVLGGQAQGRRVGAGTRLAQGERRDGPPGPDLWEPALAVGGGARLDDRGGAESLEGEGGLGLGAAPGQGLAQHAQVQRPGAQHPAEEAQLAESGQQRAVDAPRFSLLRQRAQLMCGKGAELLAPGGLFRFEGECRHGGASLVASFRVPRRVA